MCIAELKFSSRESRRALVANIFPLLISTFSGPPRREHQDSPSTIRIPRMIAAACTYTRAHVYAHVTRCVRRNETLQSGVPREYGPCERSKSWPTSLPDLEKLSPHAARAFTRRAESGLSFIGRAVDCSFLQSRFVRLPHDQRHDHPFPRKGSSLQPSRANLGTSGRLS